MNLKYYLGAVLTIPLLPILYFQGKRVKSSIPKLPPADGPEGVTSRNANAKLNLITIGESTIAGLGVSTHEEGFTGNLARELSHQLGIDVGWKVYAHSGYTARKVRERILPDIEDKNVDLIVIGLGGNDAFDLNSPGKWEREINKLIRSIRELFPLAPIAFTNMPPIKEFPAFTPLMKFTLGNLAEILGKTLEKTIKSHQNVYYYDRKITLADWIERLKLGDKSIEFFSDGVHPSPFTYEIWAKDFAAFLMENPDLEKSFRSVTS